jgi:hypothetical protein
MKRLPAYLLAAALAACNAPPTAPVVAVSPVNPKTDAELKATIVTPSTDPNGDPVALTFQWLKNNERQADLTTDTVPADKTAKGDVWTVIVTPSDGVLPGPAGQASAPIQNTAPTVTAAFEPATPTKNGDLKIAPTATDADGDKVTFTYAWTKDGQTTTFATDTVPAAQLARGQKWGVTVTPNDGAETGQPFNLSVDIGNAKPVAPGVTLAPEKPTKATPIIATAQPGTDADGDAVQLKFAWTVNGTIVEGQTGAVLAPTFFAKGEDVTVIVTPNDGKEDGTPATTTINVANIAPTAPGVTITANPRTTDPIVCSVIAPSSDLDGDTLTYAFTWTKNDQPFNSAVTTGTSSVVAAPHANGDLYSCTASVFDGATVIAGNAANTTVNDSYRSCAAIKAANGAAADGVYSIDPDGTGPIAPVSLFCDMTNGGLTLVANIYDSAGDDAPNSTDYVVSGWQQIASGAWNNVASRVEKNNSGTGSAAVSLAFVAALKASAGQQNLKMCFVHQNGTDTTCRKSADGSMTLVSYPTGNPKLTVYSGNTLPYTYGRLAGLAGTVDGYDINLYGNAPGSDHCIPKTAGAAGDWGGDNVGICQRGAPDYAEFNGPWHAGGAGATYRPAERDNSEIRGPASSSNWWVVLPDARPDIYGFRLFVGP